jgi:hypothetical protein
MAMTETQAMNFMSRVKAYYLRVMERVEVLQATALVLSQEVGAHGGISAITSAISDEAWSAAYPFSKGEFGAIASDFGNLTDVLGEHGDLKANLAKLRE